MPESIGNYAVQEKNWLSSNSTDLQHPSVTLSRVGWEFSGLLTILQTMGGQVEQGVENPQADSILQALTSDILVSSGGQLIRIGTPTVPIPRETYICDDPIE